MTAPERGVLLGPADFQRMMELEAQAKALGFHIRRPERVGGSYTVWRRRQIVIELADLDAVHDWLTAD